MITDNEGNEVAENEEEKYWQNTIDQVKADIDNTEKQLKFQRAVLDMAESKKQQATIDKEETLSDEANSERKKGEKNG